MGGFCSCPNLSWARLPVTEALPPRSPEAPAPQGDPALEGKWRIVELQRGNETVPGWMRSPGSYFSFDGGPVLVPALMFSKRHEDPFPPQRRGAPDDDRPGRGSTGANGGRRATLLRDLFVRRQTSRGPDRFRRGQTPQTTEGLFDRRTVSRDPGNWNASIPSPRRPIVRRTPSARSCMKPGSPASLPQHWIHSRSAVWNWRRCTRRRKRESWRSSGWWRIAPRAKRGKRLSRCSKGAGSEPRRSPRWPGVSGWSGSGDRTWCDAPGGSAVDLALHLLTRVRHNPRSRNRRRFSRPSSRPGCRLNRERFLPPSAKPRRLIVDRWGPAIRTSLTSSKRLGETWDQLGGSVRERLLRTVIAKTPHARIRVLAQRLALATAVNTAGEGRQDEARKLYTSTSARVRSGEDRALVAGSDRPKGARGQGRTQRAPDPRCGGGRIPGPRGTRSRWQTDQTGGLPRQGRPRVVLGDMGVARA